MSVKLVVVTPEAEKTMAYIARVSSPNQENPEYARLLKYCLDHGHYSVFEHAHMTLEIKTSRMISPQMLRHWSARFQEFSQRYSEVEGYIEYEARMQAEKNRQSSTEGAPPHLQKWWKDAQREVWEFCKRYYDDAISFGLARECARAVLPLGSATKLYMTMNCRDWIHYIKLRTAEDTQKEHRIIADACKVIFAEQFPTVAEALGWA